MAGAAAMAWGTARCRRRRALATRGAARAAATCWGAAAQLAAAAAAAATLAAAAAASPRATSTLALQAVAAAPLRAASRGALLPPPFMRAPRGAPRDCRAATAPCWCTAARFKCAPAAARAAAAHRAPPRAPFPGPTHTPLRSHSRARHLIPQAPPTPRSPIPTPPLIRTAQAIRTPFLRATARAPPCQGAPCPGAFLKRPRPAPRRACPRRLWLPFLARSRGRPRARAPRATPLAHPQPPQRCLPVRCATAAIRPPRPRRCRPLLPPAPRCRPL